MDIIINLEYLPEPYNQYSDYKTTIAVIKRDAKAFYEGHKRACEQWTYGRPEAVWFDEDSGALCIKYMFGTWFHYKMTRDGLEWW